jgi:2-C-methyl-D-erythritol 4-phosphate cytidylyltransferase
MSTALLIPAAGSGTRLGAGLPKAFVPLAGRTLLARAVDGAVRSGVVDTIVIAAPAHLLQEAEEIARAAVTAPAPVSIIVVAGGEERTVSVAAALAAVPEAENVLVHDAARCLTPVGVFHRVHAALQEGALAVVPVLPVTDTGPRCDACRRRRASAAQCSTPPTPCTSTTRIPRSRTMRDSSSASARRSQRSPATRPPSRSPTRWTCGSRS